MRVVAVFVRVVFDHKSYLSLEGIHDFRDGRTGRLAVRSLEVEELYNCYGRVLRPPLGGITNRDIKTLPGSSCHGIKKNNKQTRQKCLFHRMFSLPDKKGGTSI